jgi:type VI protein secretion system component VasK
VGLIDRLKDVKPPWARGEPAPAEGPAAPPAPPPEPETDAADAAETGEESSFSIPLAWLVAGGVLVAAWLTWSIYVAVDRGIDDGVGVLVAWPTLVAMALVVLAPLAVIVALIVRVARGGKEDDAEEKEKENEDEEDEDEDPSDDDEAEDTI